MAKLGKRTRAAREAFAGKENLSVEEAVKLIKANANAKFDESVEIAMNLGVDPRHADQMVRGTVTCPTAPARRSAWRCSPAAPRPTRRQAAGADIVGAEDLMETIQGGTIEFDRCIATPDMMPIVGRLGKILGPRNLMPNPKVGTVTMDVKKPSRPPRAARCSSRPRRPASCMPASARRRSTRPSWSRTSAPSSMRCTRPSPSGAKGTYMKKVSRQLDHGPGRQHRRHVGDRQRAEAAAE
jgi:large subunit ribosomal protein L1